MRDYLRNERGIFGVQQFPCSYFQGVSALDAGGRDQVSPYLWDDSYLTWGVARLVEERGF